MKQFLRRGVRRLGFDVVRYDGRRFAERKRLELLSSAPAGAAVVDIGANEGQFGASLRESGWQGEILSFEPLPDAYCRLARRIADDQRWSAEQCALGASRSSSQMNVAGNSWSSSLLPMSPSHLAAAPDSAYTSAATVQVRALDEFQIPPGSYIKIDTQGYELEVLRGGERMLRTAAFVEVEVSLVELYVGQPMVGEVIDYLSKRGYLPVGLFSAFSSPGGEVFQMDAFFARRTPGWAAADPGEDTDESE